VHRGPAFHTVPESWRTLTPPSKNENARFPTERRKAVTCRWQQKPCSPKIKRNPVLHTAPSCRRVSFLLSKSWNPSSTTERQSTTLLVPGCLPPTVHRDPVLLIVLQESSHATNKEHELHHLAEDGLICTTAKILQRLTFPAYSILRTTAGTPQEKIQNPNYRGTRD
jgi:hypothetical protein